MRRKVVVTGIGVVSCLGIGIEKAWKNILDGKTGIKRISKFDTEGFSSKIGGQIDDFRPENFMDKKMIKKTDPFIQYAMAASILAVQDAELNLDTIDRNRFGVFIGSGIGGINEVCNQQMILANRGPKRISPFFIPNAIANLASGHVSMHFNAKGPNSSVCTACATGTHAIGDAMMVIRRGQADIMIAGGSEAPLMPLAVAGFCSMRALSTRNDQPEKASRPFDKERDGFIISEGSAIVILEEERHALERGARIYCEVRGYGMSGDAYHLSAPAPEGEGAARCMQAALQDAGIKPEDISYINAHGTSTPLNDKFETMAIKSVFGEKAYEIPINSTKSFVGHMLGAAGAFEFGIVAKSIQNGIIHKTANYSTPDPECDLDYTVNENKILDIQYALSNSFGFGGTNASLVAARYPMK